MAIKFESKREEEKKLRKDISDIADYYRKTKIGQILNLIITTSYSLLILIFVAGTVYSVFVSGTFSSLFGDKADLTRRFDCVSSNYSDTVKTFTEAKFFVDLFGGSCKLYHVDGNMSINSTGNQNWGYP